MYQSPLVRSFSLHRTMNLECLVDQTGHVHCTSTLLHFKRNPNTPAVLKKPDSVLLSTQQRTMLVSVRPLFSEAATGTPSSHIVYFCSFCKAQSVSFGSPSGPVFLRVPLPLYSKWPYWCHVLLYSSEEWSNMKYDDRFLYRDGTFRHEGAE